MKIEGVDFFYLSMPEVTTAADGSQDALVVRVSAGGLIGWGECEASPLVSIAAFVTPMSHGACRPVSASVLGRDLNAPEDIHAIAADVAYYSMDLLQAIRCVLAGGNYVDPALAARILSPRNSIQCDPGNLSERERSVIQLVALGYSNKEISSRLNLSIKTIETYRTRATDKLELHSRAAIVRFAQSNGWLAELQL